MFDSAWNASTSPVAVGIAPRLRVAGSEHAAQLVEGEEGDAVDERRRTRALALTAGGVGDEEHERGVRDQRRKKRGEPLRNEGGRSGEHLGQTPDRLHSVRHVVEIGMALH